MNDKVNFLIVGAQKSGTTALNAYLRDHSELQMANKKEVHFFDQDNFFSDTVDYEKYHQHFSNIGNKITGECTPIYMYWDPSIRRIYEYNPEIKIISILRNPIERAYSHWNMMRDHEVEDMCFSTAIRQENDRCREALPFQHRDYSYIDRGFYSEQIRRIWRYFPKEQTLFIKHDELKLQPEAVLNEVYRFLGVSEIRFIQEKNLHSSPYINSINAKDYLYLDKIFSNEIPQIEKMLGWDCSNWRYKKVNRFLQRIKEIHL